MDATPSPDATSPRAATCSVSVSGAVQASWTTANTIVTNYGDLTFSCPMTIGTMVYDFRPSINGVTGPGTYQTWLVQLDRTCTLDSCPGDYGFTAVNPETTCTAVIGSYSPATRGGMTAHFTCPDLPIDDFEDPSDKQFVSISADFDFPPIVDGRGVDIDAGAIGDAGPPSCHMTIVGAGYDASIQGGGYGMSAEPDGVGPPDAAAQILGCGGWLEGTSYALMTSWTSSSNESSTSLEVNGASWCTSGCDISYEATPCTVDVLVDEGEGRPFKANFACDGLTLWGVDAGIGSPFRVFGSIDGTHERHPPPQ